jgi:hypothetical protein
MSPPTISDSGVKRKMYMPPFPVALSLLERLYVEFYAQKYGRDKVDVLRGMLRKFVEVDEHFSPETFVKWVEKTYVPQVEDKSMRDAIKDVLKEFEAKTEKAGRGKR